MEIIEKELEEKTIERMDDPLVLEPEPVKKPKKKRTQAQIDAFEKARLARTEKIAARKKQKEEDKLKKKEQKKVIKQKVEEELDQVSNEILKEIVRDPTEDKPPSPEPVKKTTFKEDPEGRPRPFNPADPIVNNHYYYYGMPPQTHYQTPEPEPPRPKKSRRKKRPPTPSSSESESEGEEWTYQEEQGQPQYFQQPSAYKFNYA